MRDGRSDAELSNAIAGVWTKRADRYSETRTINTDGLVLGARKVEMSYIGG
jgi:cyclic pyranopterin phosphate synthase